MSWWHHWVLRTPKSKTDEISMSDFIPVLQFSAFWGHMWLFFLSVCRQDWAIRTLESNRQLEAGATLFRAKATCVRLQSGCNTLGIAQLPSPKWLRRVAKQADSNFQACVCLVNSTASEVWMFWCQRCHSELTGKRNLNSCFKRNGVQVTLKIGWL